MKIVLIGSGNVATHLGLALIKSGYKVLQVYSQKKINASILAAQLNADAVDNLVKIVTTADIYILSIKDDAIQKVIENLPNVDGIVVHTAGSINMNVLDRFNRYGVIYPFQTFSKNRYISFKNIPLLIEGSSNRVIHQLKDFASTISNIVQAVDSYQRLKIHVSAVFACNFTNHMYLCAKEILDDANLPFSIVHNLIEETAAKAIAKSPKEAQTGPASRGDKATIDKHIKLLQEILTNNDLVDLYKDLSNRILTFYHRAK